jgi:hypothetical protein
MREVKHTKGLEYYTMNGLEYVGQYYLNPENNIAYIYDDMKVNTKILIPRHTFNTETIRLRSITKGGYEAPVPIKVKPTDLEYTVGIVTRYFVQKRNSPLNTIVEIDSEQFSNIKSNSKKSGIDLNIYNSVSFQWMISGNSRYVQNFNLRQIRDNLKDFKGLDKFLKNSLEFYK